MRKIESSDGTTRKQAESIETSVHRRYRRTKFQSAVLETLYLSGLVTVALLAPNALQVFALRERGMNREPTTGNFKQLLKRLQDQKLVTVQRDPKGIHISLTVHGRRITEQMYGYRLRLKKPKQWDRKWRLVVFDIKEKQKGRREQFRKTIQSLGFQRLQHSVWVTPYPCEELVELLRRDLRLGRGVLYMVVEEIQGAGELKRKFDL